LEQVQFTGTRDGLSALVDEQFSKILRYEKSDTMLFEAPMYKYHASTCYL